MLPHVMLRHLSVKNLAIVAEAQIDFDPGLNVVTGETGAGKSVLIGALNLVLGERADRGAIRGGADETIVEACFELADSRMIDRLLEEMGLPSCEEGVLIVRRRVSANGGGRCQLNDATVTVQTLRRVGDLLVDMHGPYEHQSLLANAAQRTVLDAYGHCGAEAPLEGRSYREGFEAWRQAQSDKERLLESTGNAAEEIDRLNFIVSEIESAQLTPADDEELLVRHAEAANAAAILEAGNEVRTILEEGEPSAFDVLVSAQHALSNLAKLLPDAEAWLEEARAATLQVQELSRTVEDRLQRIETDPGELEALETRMARVQRLKRMYGPTLGEVLDRLETSQSRLRELQTLDMRLAELDADIARHEQTMRHQASILSRARRGAADRLTAAITGELRGLGFEHAAFDIEITPTSPGPQGADQVDFRFAPNAGEGAAPLRAIASSGEIARVMLAIKSILAEHDAVPVLVFDEIDANIGGAIGRAVGRKLRQVAGNRQVICITHLPQVAAYGQTHFAVNKVVRNARTHARIARVSDRERATELARMLGGADMTSVTLKHAGAMLQACQKETL